MDCDCAKDQKKTWTILQERVIAKTDHSIQKVMGSNLGAGKSFFPEVSDEDFLLKSETDKCEASAQKLRQEKNFALLAIQVKATFWP